MKGSLRISKGSAKHITHNFDAEHIDKERTGQNIYWTWDKQDKATADDIEAAELEFYEKNYREYLDNQNKKYEQKRQYKRMKTMKEYYEANKPDEIILQVGKMGETIEPEKLNKIANMFIKNLEKKYGKNVHVLSYALHADEATPHIHLRLSYDYLDKGVRRFGINKALEELGFKKQKEEFKIKKDKDGNEIKVETESRYNNKKIDFTDKLRTAFYDFCEAFGIEINRTVENPSHRYLEAQLFKAQKQKEENERNEAEFKKQIAELKEEVQQLQNEAEEARKYYNDKKMTFEEVKADIDKNCNEGKERYQKQKDEELENYRNEANKKFDADCKAVDQDFDNRYIDYVQKKGKNLTQRKVDYKQKLDDLGLSGYDTIKIDDFSL